jgi:hypothetical protein
LSASLIEREHVIGFFVADFLSDAAQATIAAMVIKPVLAKGEAATSTVQLTHICQHATFARHLNCRSVGGMQCRNATRP